MRIFDIVRFLLAFWGMQLPFAADAFLVTSRHRSFLLTVSGRPFTTIQTTTKSQLHARSDKKNASTSTVTTATKDRHAKQCTVALTVSKNLDEMHHDAQTWIKQVNRPKKLRVSGHSLLGTIATVCFGCAVFPHVVLFGQSSTTTTLAGWPHFYDLSNFDNLLLAKAVSGMFALTAVIGLTRIPKYSGALRRTMFETAACMSMLLYVIQDSDVGIIVDHGSTSSIGGNTGLFELLDVTPSWVFAMCLWGVTVWKALHFLEQTILGGEQGRETLPFNGSRIGMATIASSMVMLLFLNGPIVPACFFDHNRQAFEELCLPGLQTFGGWHTSGYFVVEAYVGFGMLISTLLFERKIDQTQASVLMAVNFVVSGLYDAAQFFVQFGGSSGNTAAGGDVAATTAASAALQTMLDYGQGVMDKFSLYEIGIILWSFVFVKTMIQFQDEQKQRLEATTIILVEAVGDDEHP